MGKLDKSKPCKLAKLLARVKRTNAEFKKATRAEKRVMLARDVIAALKAKAMDAKIGCYLLVDERKVLPGEPGYWFETSVINETLTDAPEESFKDTLPNLPECNVCAKGALLVSCVARRNQVTNAEAARGEIFYGGNLSSALGGIFSNAQLDLIEAEFEREDVQDTQDFDWEPAMKYREDYTERMVAIMKNIIRNKGTFKPREGE